MRTILAIAALLLFAAVANAQACQCAKPAARPAQYQAAPSVVMLAVQQQGMTGRMQLRRSVRHLRAADRLDARAASRTQTRLLIIGR